MKTKEQFIAGLVKEGHFLTRASLLKRYDVIKCTCSGPACTGWRLKSKNPATQHGDE